MKLRELSEERHPLDLQIAKEMALDHVTEKKTKFFADMAYWDPEHELIDHEQLLRDTDHNPEAADLDTEYEYRNHIIIDPYVGHVYHRHPDEYLIQIKCMFVHEDDVKHPAFQELDRHDMFQLDVIWIYVDVDRDKTIQVRSPLSLGIKDYSKTIFHDMYDDEDGEVANLIDQAGKKSTTWRRISD